MNYRKIISVVVLLIAICICSLGCASYSVRRDGKTNDLLCQVKVTQTKSHEGAGVPVDVKGWGYLADLPSALSLYGYRNEINNPAYRIEADVVFDMDPHLGTHIAWDIFMAIPSIVLPVPMFSGRMAKLSVTITEGTTGKLLRQMEETLTESFTAYSIYGFMGSGKMQNGLVGVTAMLLDKELKKLEEK